MILTLLISLLAISSCTEVDNLNILLPQLQEAIPTFPLQLITAQEGCFHWTSSLPTTINVAPHNPKTTGCSHQALISVAQVGSFPSSIFVSADDANSESLIKIPVRIRKLHKITIASKSRMMNIREIQRLELFAFDSDQNTFTSIEGLRFKWKLEQANQILELVPLSNAKLFLPLRTRENIEKSGFQSDMIVLRALAPGNLRITATCIEPGYESLSDEITISVHQRFELKPGPIIRMAPETTLQLRLVRPSLQEIQIPQPYYKIISCTGFIVNSTLHLTAPNSRSSCTLKVQDTRTRPPYESSVDIIVDYADEIRIITSPLVIVRQQSPYEIQLLREGVPLLGSSNKVQIKSDFTVDAARKMLTASRKMTGTISAQLDSLRKETSIHSFLPVGVILPNGYLHLPVGEYFKLKMLGGTGLFDFEINSEVATVSSIYVLHARAVGDITVTVRDRNHLSNTVTFRLKVSELVEIHSLEAEKELNRDEWGNMYVIGKSPAHQTFTQCNYASFSLTVPSANLDFDRKLNPAEAMRQLQAVDSGLVQQILHATSLLKGKHHQMISNYQMYVQFEEINAQDLRQHVMNLENYGICKIIRFKSIVTLEEHLSISLDGEEGISTRVPIRVYHHISTTIQGDSHQFLLTPESSLKWSYTGGSYHWPHAHTSIQINGKDYNQTAHPIISCSNQESPPAVYQLTVMNHHTKRLLFPTAQHANITIICKFPRKLRLSLDHGQAFDELFIQSSRQVKGQVSASDEFNELFYNASNVRYEFSSMSGTISNINQQFNYKPNGINDTLTFFTEQLKSGLRYKRASMKIQIFIVQSMTVAHPLAAKDLSKNISILTLFTPKKPYIINVYDLHSQVYVQCSKAVSCERGSNYVAVKLLKLGVGYVTIRDKKVYGSESWNFQFTVVEADEIRFTGDRDYVQEGELLQVNIANYYNGRLISPYTYEPSYLQLILDRRFRIVEQKLNYFVVKAEQAGEYDILAENTYPMVLRSKPFHVTVYREIKPTIQSVSKVVQEGGLIAIQAQAAILIGCKRLIRIEGGPDQMDLTFQATSQNVKVHSLGRKMLQIESSKEGNFEVVITVDYKGNRIAVITIAITARAIQSIELQGIDEPVVGSHFRIHPKFKVGDAVLQDSTCDFNYVWSTSSRKVQLGQSMSFGYIDAAGINVTAVRPGSEIISLEVISKQSLTSLGKVSKYIEVLQDVDLYLPTYIGKAPCCPPTSVLMPPSTRYTFDEHLTVSAEGTVVTAAEKRNIIDSGKRSGHTTIALTRVNHRPLHVYVEVKPILGIFLANTEGFLELEPGSTLSVPIYLQDSTGRLFVSPLQHLDMLAYSSNTQLLKVDLSPHHNSLSITGKGEGIVILSVVLPGRNLIDSIAVSIGSALSPGKQVRVLSQGTVQFSSISAQGKWSSSNPQAASIDSQTGLVSAHAAGLSKISIGDLSSTLQVLQIGKIRQVGAERYKGSSMEITYQVLWQTQEGLEELPHLGQQGPVSNKFLPRCSANSRYLTTSISMLIQEGKERFQCTVSALEGEQLPSKLSVSIKDKTEAHLQSFDYELKPHFILEKTSYNLSPGNAKVVLSIKSKEMIHVGLRKGRAEWVTSYFNEQQGEQSITVDMGSDGIEGAWWLQLSCTGQKEEVQFVFSSQKKEGREHSFWSFHLDWPDYLIIAMALVFGTICYIQYSNDEKIKSS